MKKKKVKKKKIYERKREQNALEKYMLVKVAMRKNQNMMPMKMTMMIANLLIFRNLKIPQMLKKFYMQLGRA